MENELTNIEEQWPEELRELQNPQYRTFVMAFVRNGGNAAQAAKEAGFGHETSTALTFAQIGRRILNTEGVGTAIIEFSKRFTRSLAPKAVRAIKETLELPPEMARDRLRAAGMILDRTDAVAQRVQVEHQHKCDPVRITVELIAEQKQQGLSRDEIMRILDLTEFELAHYEKLAAKEQPIDAEFKELPAPTIAPAPDDADPDFAVDGSLKEAVDD